MANWNWLSKPETPYNWAFILRVLLKTAALFAALNLAFALLSPMPALGRASLYNTITPARARLPYGEDPASSYSLSLMNLEAMFASHALAAPKAPGEYRVLLVGDSATWGFLLKPQDTLAGQINAAGHNLAGGRQLRAYNLGYPVMSLTKDLMLLDYAMRYHPDLVVWPVTLKSFPRSDEPDRDKQLFPPLVQHNPAALRRLIAGHGLNLDPEDPRLLNPTLLEKTLAGERRALADLLRLQLYGANWGATGIDQVYPEDYKRRQEDFKDEDVLLFQGMEAGPLTENELAFDVLRAGVALVEAGGVPLLLVNEPIFISEGKNSHLRYNAFYPRWAYDDYRAQLSAMAEAEGWPFLDLWDLIQDGAQFTDSAVHLTPEATHALSERVGAAIVALAEGGG